MKKTLILAAVAAIAAVGCTKTYHQVDPATQGPAIGFGTWTETLTKARAQGGNTFTVGDDFAVYGAKIVNSPASTTTVFDDDVVTMTVAGTPGTWTYPNPRFWDPNTDSYIFYAVSPASVGTNGTVNPQTGVMTSASITFAGNDNDILVADKKTVLKANYGEQVQIDFNHVASLLDFKVAKAPALHDAVVKVTAFSLDNIESTGVMSVSDAYNATVYNGTVGPVVTWSSSSATTSYGPASGVTPVDISTPITITEDTAFPVPAEPADGKSTTIINNLVVKPQTFGTPADPEDFTEAKQQLSITYTITTASETSAESTTTYTSKLWLADFDIVNNAVQTDEKVAGWQTGKHYVFYITLDAKPIVFGATINNWTPATGYHYLIQ